MKTLGLPVGELSCLPRNRGRHVHVYTETQNNMWCQVALRRDRRESGGRERSAADWKEHWTPLVSWSSGIVPPLLLEERNDSTVCPPRAGPGPGVAGPPCSSLWWFRHHTRCEKTNPSPPPCQGLGIFKFKFNHRFTQLPGPGPAPGRHGDWNSGSNGLGW